MKRKPKKLALHRETLLTLSVVQGAYYPTKIGSDCEACITITIPVTELDCMSAGCPTGVWSVCPASCGINTCGIGC